MKMSEIIQKLCICPPRVCQNAKNELPRDMLPTEVCKLISFVQLISPQKMAVCAHHISYTYSIVAK